jgi:ubiquinone/menaquinone biosynthesis C-methylase UbiE
VDYWDRAVKGWAMQERNGGSETQYPGDDWSGHAAGLDLDTQAYAVFVYEHFIQPYVTDTSDILEVGAGSGRMTQHLLREYRSLICTDVSEEMLGWLHRRLGKRPGVRLLRTGGVDLDGVTSEAIDFVFSWATFIRLRPHDVYSYLVEIARVLRPGGIGVLHHANTLSDLGWRQFIADMPKNLLMRCDPLSFSVMTPQLMEKFVSEAGLQVIELDTSTVPRDCVAIFRRPHDVHVA